MKIISGAECNIGNVRENNEDNLYLNGLFLSEAERETPKAYEKACEDKLQFYAVCDGMGGEEYGEKASFIAVETLEKYHKMLAGMQYHSLSKYTDMYFQEVNSKICEIDRDYRSGTTIALFISEGEKVHILNIGDSRVYRYRHNKLTQLSEDHTPAVRAYKMGLIKKEDIKNHPHRNQLTQYLGIAPEEQTLVPFRMEIKPKSGDRFLICSDGLNDMLTDAELSAILKESKTPAAAVKTLVESANEKGGKDNITAIVLDIEVNKKFLWF